MSNHLQILYQNTRGLRTKTNEILNSISQCDCSVIALTETWLDQSVHDSEIFPQNYNVYRADRNYSLTKCTRGGGVLIGVIDRLKSVRMNLDTIAFTQVSQKIDILIVKIICDFNSIFLVNIYIPPQTTTGEYEQLFEALETLDYLYNGNTLITGDFNIPDYSNHIENHITNNQISLLINFAEVFNLHQHNFVQNINNKLLDLVWYNSGCLVERSLEPLVKEDGHHPSLMLYCKLSSNCKLRNNLPNNFQNSYNFRRCDFPNLYDKVTHIDWSFLQTFQNADQACDYFYVPKYNKIKKTNYPPWFDYGIIKNLKLKSRHWRRYKISGDMKDFEEFSRIRRLIKKNVDSAYVKYMTSLEKDIKNNPQKFWSFINTKKGNANVSDEMTYNDTTLSTPDEIVNAFADLFSKSFTPPSHPQLNTVNCTSDSHTLSINEFGEEEVMIALKSIKPKMTMGPDCVPAFFVDCACLLAKPLTVLYNICLRTQTFPLTWKTSRVCPIFKKGDKHDINNFRPITVICNFGCAELFLEPLRIMFNLIIKTHTYPDTWKKTKICPVYKSGNKNDIVNHRPIALICAPSKLFETIIKYNIYVFDMPYNTLLKEHNYQKLESRRSYASALFVYKLFNAKIKCHALLEQFGLLVPHYYRRSTNLLFTSRPRTNLGENAPIYRLAKIANSVQN
ncbi:hypothetical protein NQ317_013376, partial [Molorchus minor]